MTKESRNIPDLHDAILLSVDLKWEENTAVLRFEPVQLDTVREERVVIRSSGVYIFSYQHRQPWGRSKHVNRVELRESPHSGFRQFQLEMQSGDLIEFEAETITFEHELPTL
jgi:hypothetical protein